MAKYTARMLFKDFRKAHPELWSRGTNYELAGFMKILVRAPGIGKFTYEYFGDKITWIEKWVDEAVVMHAAKQRDITMREKDYGYFIAKLTEVMETKKLTQEAVSLVTGVSRQSINAYLSGRKIPKTNTMRKIGKPLGIDI